MGLPKREGGRGAEACRPCASAQRLLAASSELRGMFRYFGSALRARAVRSLQFWSGEQRLVEVAGTRAQAMAEQNRLSAESWQRKAEEFEALPVALASARRCAVALSRQNFKRNGRSTRSRS